MIELKHLSKQFSNTPLLCDVNAVIHDGDVVSVIGPSGSGKSTLLRCINMLDPPTSGQIIVDGEDITASLQDAEKIRLKIGMVFRSFNLFGNMTVIENIVVPQMDLLGRSGKDAFEKGMQLLKKVGMADKYLKYPDELSDGQQQLVAIVRTLAMDPSVILLDEPTSALDPSMIGEVKSVIQNLADSGITMMIVTHDMNFAKKICNRVFYLDQGGLYEEGTPEQIFDNPRRERTRAFIKHLKVFTYKCQKADFDGNECQTKLAEFIMNNNIPEDKSLKLITLMLWFRNNFLFSYLAPNSVLNLIIEYNEDTQNVNALMYGTLMNSSDDKQMCMLQTRLERFAKDAVVRRIDDRDYEIKISCNL